MSSSASGHALLAVLGLDAVVPGQRGGDVAAARGDPAEVVADLGRGERLADRLVQPLGAQEVGLGGGQGAEVTCSTPRLHSSRASHSTSSARRNALKALAVARPATRRSARAAAGSSPAAPASAPATRPPAQAARARPRPAPTAMSPCWVSAQRQAHPRLAGAARPTRRPPPDRHRAAQVHHRGVGVAELDRGQPQRALGRRPRLAVGRRRRAPSAPAERAARASAEARRTASSACSSTVAMDVTLPQPTLARHPADRRGSQHERTARALGPTQGRRQPRQGERASCCAPASSWSARATRRTRRPCSPAGRPQDRRTFGVTAFTRTPQNPEDPAQEVLDAIARLRKATANRPQGPVRVAPNHVLVGRGGITLDRRAAPAGRPRLLGAPGQAARRRSRCGPPARGDGKGVKIAVLDTGLFEHDWLTPCRRPRRRRRLGRRARPVRRQRVRPRHVHRRPDPAGRARRRGLRRQGARLARRRRRPHRRQGDGAAAAGHRHRQPLARRLHRRGLRAAGDRLRAADACASSAAWSSPPRATTAQRRPFWPAAFKQVLAVGAVDQKGAQWLKADFSNYGWWVDAAARGVNLSRRSPRARRRPPQGATPQPADRPDDRASTAGPPGTARRSRHRSPPACSPARCRATASHRRGRARTTCWPRHRRRRSPTSRSRCWWTSWSPPSR